VFFTKERLSYKFVAKELSFRKKSFRPDRFQKPVRSGANIKVLFGLKYITKQPLE